MESDKNPFPKIDLFPIAIKLGRFLLDRHSVPDGGAAAFIDAELYDVPEETRILLDYNCFE